MQNERERERARIDGQAGFAVAAFLTGVGLIYLLERVGAPDGLVRALGPLFAVSGFGLLGILSRSTRMPTFFTAERAIPAAYGGLCLAAMAAGLALCLGPPGQSALSLAGLAAGLGLNALVVAPQLRATQASGLADLLATRFPGLPLRTFVAVLLATIGALIAAAGAETATRDLIALYGPSRSTAAAIVSAAVILMVAPGGLAGVVWCAAASAGMMLIILILPVATQLATGSATLPALTHDVAVAFAALWPPAGLGAAGELLVGLATGLAIASLSPLTAAAIASADERQAFRAGVYGLLVAGAIALAALVDLGMGPPTAPMATGLRASASVLGALVLAGGGVHAAGRAWGVNLTARRGPHALLASQQLARARVAMILVTVVCGVLTAKAPLNPPAALTIAAALSLAAVTPLVALALFSRAASAHAAAGALASLASGGFLVLLGKGIPDPGRLLICALASAAAGFAVGWSATAFTRSSGEPPPRHDLFIDAPFDSGV